MPLHRESPSEWFERLYVARFKDLVAHYKDMVDAAVRGRPTLPSATWDTFEEILTQVCQNADVIAASKVRWRGVHQRLVVPAGVKNTDPANFTRIVDANPWLSWHRTQTAPVIRQRVALIKGVERDFLAKRAATLQTLGTQAYTRGNLAVVPLYRLEMQRRAQISQIAAVSEQVELADPEVGGAFPWAAYFTRDDRRVRPTHKAMQGFVALRTDPIWRKITPPNSFNCRCDCWFGTRDQGIEKGWADKTGKPRFTIRWPNAEARRNFEDGTFPEWKGERFVAP